MQSVTTHNPEEVVSGLKEITQKLFNWFTQSEMKANLRKCYILLSTTESFNFKISETVICNT